MAKISIDSSKKAKFTRNNTQISVSELEEILEYCKNKLNIDTQKGASGCIYAYNTGVTGDISGTDGVIFMDFDKLPKQYIDTILDNFYDLASVCAPLLAIQPSYSYYHYDNKCGLHVYFKSLPLSGESIKNEYENLSKWGLILFTEFVQRKCGFDLSSYIDTHNINIKQRFFLNYADYRYNKFATPLTENTIKEKDKKILKDKYKRKVKFYDNNISTTKSVKVSRDTDYNVTVNKVQTNSYPEYNDRYKMVNTLTYLGWDRDDIIKLMCDLRGRDDNKFKIEISGYCNTARSKVANLTQAEFNFGCKILNKWGVIVTEKNNNNCEIPENEYLSYYKDLIINKFEKYNRLLIQAPTGTGKTTLMKELAKKYNAVILVPFNSMLRLYEDCCTIVGSGYGAEYTEDKPVCMVWDQAIKYDLSNRLVISDETHQWFFDRTYRQSAVKTINQAKKWNKIICISATPAGEEEELNLYRLKFTKKRNTIRTAFVSSKNSGGFIKGLLNGRELNLNYIVFSDRHAMKLYQNFPEGCLLHSEKRNTQEFKDVIRDERLSNSITFCTALAYNGLNFRNTGDYKVIIDIKEGEDTANKIIQAVGRLRNANITEVTIVFTKNTVRCDSKRSVSEKVIDNNIIKEFIERNNGKSIIDFDERYTEQDSIEALTTIEKYLISHSSKENIISDLINEGYFSIQEYYDGEKHEKLELVEKKESNKKLKEIILNSNGCIDEIKAEELNDYQKKWIKRMNKINALVNVDWVRFINGRKMDSLLETLFEEVRLIYEVCRLTKEEFEFYYSDDKLNEISNLKDSNGDRISDIGYKIVKNRFALARKIREMYELVDTYEVDPMTKVLDEFMGIKEDNRIKSIKLKSEGGKKGGLKGKSITIKDNKGKIFHFDTYEECRVKKLDNCSTATFRNFLKGTSKYNKKYIIISD